MVGVNPVESRYVAYFDMLGMSQLTVRDPELAWQAISGLNKAQEEILQLEIELQATAETIDDGWHVRFIEHMPVTGDASINLVTVKDMKKSLDVLGKMEPIKMAVGNGPAKYYRFPGAKGTIGFITPVTEHFCYQCNRLRLTADGKLRPCLLSEEEIDLREALRSGATSDELKSLIEKAIACKPERHYLTEGKKPNGRPFSQVGG